MPPRVSTNSDAFELGSVTKRLLSSHGPACVQRATPCCAPRDDHIRPTVPPLLYAHPVFIGMLGQVCTATFLLRFQISLQNAQLFIGFGMRRQVIRYIQEQHKDAMFGQPGNEYVRSITVEKAADGDALGKWNR